MPRTQRSDRDLHKVRTPQTGHPVVYRSFRMSDHEPIFTEVPWDPDVQAFLDQMIRVRPDLYLDPMVGEPWSCDPARCRPRLGPNLCCKVERRCRHFDGKGCRIHSTKPFACALFPLDLVTVRGIRVVTTVKNPDFFRLGWCRFDRDMLCCFPDQSAGAPPMIQAQEPVLRRVFTAAEWNLMLRALGDDTRVLARAESL